MTIEQILEAMETAGLEKEMSFSIDYIDEYNNECIVDIEIEFDEDASMNEFHNPTWVITSSDSDCEHYCSITDEYEEGIFIGSQDVKHLLKLEECGIDDCDHEYYDARNFESEDEANMGYFVTDKSGKRVFFTLDFWKRSDNGLWQVVASKCEGAFDTNPADEFPVGLQVSDEVLDEIETRWNN